MGEAAHDLVDDLVGVLLAFAGQVQVFHGGLETGMAEIALDDADVDAGLKEVSRVGMTQRMNGDARPGYAGLFLGPDKGALHARAIHKGGRFRSLSTAPAAGGEDEMSVAVSFPVTAQQVQALRGKRDVAILRALAAMDVNEHAV